MKKVAIIFESSPYDRKGLFNAVHNRTLNLVASGEFEVDAYCMQIRDGFLSRCLRKMPKVAHKDLVEVEKMPYNMLWRRFSYADELRRRLSMTPKSLHSYAVKRAELFKDYDFVVAHSYEAGLVAYEIKKQFGIPYTVTWHGSDVHTHPMNDVARRSLTAKIMKQASVNFFVSETLLAASSKITDDAQKVVLYNGVSEDFYRYSDEERNNLRKAYGLEPQDKIVAYVGNFHPVKNVTVLPELFSRIHDHFEMYMRECLEQEGELKFWVIGDGKLRSALEPQIRSMAGSDVKFWGNMPAEEMPKLMNMINVLLLPSRNEGLPLVTLEALKCGASVLGSEVGGIPEVIGREYCVPFAYKKDGTLDYESADFADRLAQKAVKQLFYPKEQVLNPRFDWSQIAKTEITFLKELA